MAGQWLPTVRGLLLPRDSVSLVAWARSISVSQAAKLAQTPAGEALPDAVGLGDACTGRTRHMARHRQLSKREESMVGCPVQRFFVLADVAFLGALVGVLTGGGLMR